MNKIYDIKIDAKASRIIRVKAPDARTAMEMLLSMYFNSDAITFNNRDVLDMDVTAEAVLPENEADYSDASCERYENSFSVYIDGEDCGFADDMADEI